MNTGGSYKIEEDGALSLIEQTKEKIDSEATKEFESPDAIVYTKTKKKTTSSPDGE